MKDEYVEPVDGAQLLGVLGREVPIRLLNCSSSGCLIEAGSPMAVGTVASLRVRFVNGEFVDSIRVVRCQPIAGAGSLFHLGAEFLWTGTPDATSLRAMLRTSSDRSVAPKRAEPRIS